MPFHIASSIRETLMSSHKNNFIFYTALLLNVNVSIVGMDTIYTPSALTSNPIQHLTIMKTTRDLFETKREMVETKQHELTQLIEQYKALLTKYEQVCPLFLLGECTKEIGNIALENNCLLSRMYKPDFRQKFDQHVSQLLCNKLQASTTTNTVYTSFGCGDAFQDLIIITKALIQQPKAFLTIHLIDGKNTPYVAAVDFLNHSRQIKTEHEFSFGSRLAQYERYARNKEKNDPVIQALTHDELKQQLTLLCIEQEAQYKQLLSWLTQQFSSSHISLYLHDNIINYCDFIKKNNLTHADVLTTADIEDDGSRMTNSIDHYYILCQKTLTEKPTSVNAWLGKLANNSVGILTASLPTPSSNICFAIDKFKTT